VLTLRGAQVRDALFWSKVIDKALVRFGGASDVQLASHGWPTWGNDRVTAFLAAQRDTYRYIHDRTLFAANNGATLHEVADGVAEPAAQRISFAARGYYGTINHNMKATYQRYYGWWDGNPANFNPLPPEQSAVKYVALMGGADKVADAGETAIAAGEYRWAAELLARLVFAEPKNARGRALLASAYDQLGYQAESGPWRNYYLGAAATLRGNELPRVLSNGQNREFVSAIPTRAIFDALATRFDAAKGAGMTGTFQFILPDTGEQVEIQVSGGVEFPRLGSRAANPTATITIDRKTLDDVSLGTANFAQLLQSGVVRIEGDRNAFLGWFALHPPAAPRFNVVEP
jgi:alkyl sulfatase BDS1-like metallo-beta-lactamase superfamily hydrolase